MATGASRMCDAAVVATASFFALPPPTPPPCSRLVCSMLAVDFKSTLLRFGLAPAEAGLWLLVWEVRKCCCCCDCSGALPWLAPRVDAASLSFVAISGASSVTDGPSSVIHGSHDGSFSLNASVGLCRDLTFAAVDGYLTSEKPTKPSFLLAASALSSLSSQGINKAAVALVLWTHLNSLTFNGSFSPTPSAAAAADAAFSNMFLLRFLRFSALVDPRTRMPLLLTFHTQAASEAQDPICNVAARRDDDPSPALESKHSAWGSSRMSSSSSSSLVFQNENLL
mmetsp:Transcript_13620/g.28910  ORF Transcript_13620/g.28910 Transcript_13620/m.28910 type:complete len:282 (-) Transcript_13620:1365-2210(-)